MARLTPRIGLLLTLPPLMWAANAVAGRLAVGAVSPMLLNGLRWAIAALILLPLGWRVLRPQSLLWQRWRRFAALGLLGVGSYNALQYLALQTSTPVNVTLIASSMPVWMLAVGALRYGERASRKQLLGAAFSLAGVALVLSRGEWSTLMQVRLVPGDLFMLLAVHAVGLLFVDARAPERRLRAALAVVGVPDGAGGVRGMSGPAWRLAANGPSAARTSSGTAGWRRCCLFVAIGPSLIAYRCWGLGVATVGPAVASFFNNLTPLFAALLSAAVLAEAPRWYHALAFVLIAAGIVVSSRR